MGYSDEKVRAACRQALDEGWTHFKVKVGADPADDIRRVGMVREQIGPDRVLMVDANQRWNVGEAIARVQELARFSPLWIEEPTSPDDVLGHAAIAAAIRPIGVATGEHCANRVIFKQLLQAKAIAFCQIDSCRLGGVNENLAVMLMAAKFGVPVPACGAGLCELSAPVDVRLHRSGHDGQPRDGVRRPSASTRRPGCRHAQHGTYEAWLHESSKTRARCTPIRMDRCGRRRSVRLPPDRGTS